MAVKFNNGRGALCCDHCYVIMQQSAGRDGHFQEVLRLIAVSVGSVSAVNKGATGWSAQLVFCSVDCAQRFVLDTHEDEADRRSVQDALRADGVVA